MYIGIIVLIQSVLFIIFMRSSIIRFKQLEDSINDLKTKINFLETEGWRVSYDNLMNADKIKDLEKKLFKIMMKEKI